MHGKILVVDDDPDVLRLMSYIVEGEGHAVMAVKNGPEALTTIERERPTLVILDLMMPGVDGFQVCERIRANPDLADTKILAVTGYAEPANMRRILALGADEYVEKPLDIEGFLRKVSQLVCSRRSNATEAH